MKYAILTTGGKQYKVTEGNVLEVEKLEAQPGQDVTFDNVLLYAEDGGVKVGQPTVNGVVVTAKIVEQTKGKKIRVMKYKSKVRYRRTTGHRQLLTKVMISAISSGKSSQKKQENVTTNT